MSGPGEREVIKGLPSFSPKTSFFKQLPHNCALRLLPQPLPRAEQQSFLYFLHPKKAPASLRNQNSSHLQLKYFGGGMTFYCDSLDTNITDKTRGNSEMLLN